MHTTTKENLRAALRGGAYAGAKYLCFAAHARLHDRPDLAALFERTAAIEHGKHFSDQAALAGLVGSDIENLRDAIATEAYEVDVMYKRFADAAAAVGDVAASARFAEIGRDGEAHLAAFRESLTRLEEEAAAEPAVRALSSKAVPVE
jgi:rubrerythrin